MGIKLCGALHTLNQLGILHRDIKPSNVMLNRYGEVVLCDFGLARFGIGGSTTISGPVNGFTPVYAPPEILSGARPAPSGDVYSLAATLFCCAGGRPPFAAPSIFQVLTQVITGPTPRLELGDENADFSDLVADGMAADPDARPTARAFGEALQGLQFARGLPITEMVIADIRAIDSPRPPTPGPLTEQSLETTIAPPWPAPSWMPSGASTDATPVPPPPQPAGSTSPPSVASPRPVGPSERVEPPRRSRRRSRSEPAPWAGPDEPTVIVARSVARRRRWPGVLARALQWLPTLVGRVTAAPFRRLVHGGRVSATPAPLPVEVSRLGSVTADRPTRADLLGRGPLMEGLAQVLNDQGTALPITIAVCGQWGSGKSSLMLQLADRLCLAPSPTWTRTWQAVRFEAWRFQGREALWAGLARAIYQQTSRALPPLPRLAFRMRIERLRRGTARFASGVLVLLAGATFVVWSAISAWLGTHSWLTFAGLGAGAAALTLATSYVGALSEPFERAVARGSVTKKFDEFLGISDQAERDIDGLLDAIVDRRDQRCLVVLLDDLDRCQAALIAEALAAITEVFGRQDGRRIAFVLGVDLDVVTSAVDTSLTELRERMHRLNARRAGEMSEQFLEKVFQLSVSVYGHRRQPVEQLLYGSDTAVVAAVAAPASRSEPDDPSVAERIADLSVDNPAEITQARHDAGIHSVLLHDSDVRALHAAVRARRSSLLSVESSDVRAAEQAVVAALSMTPRAAKRFDNAFRLQLQVANSTLSSELTYESTSLVAVAKWVALRMFFPAVIRLIDQRPGTLGELEESLLADRESTAFHARIRELVPDMTAGAIVELVRLLRVNLPGSELAMLPFDSFATTTM